MTSQETLEAFGFKFGKSGAHSARSMMIVELKQLLDGRPDNATKDDYQDDVLTFNQLHKPTENARKLTFRHLVDLYGMSTEVPLFREFRKLWNLDEGSQSLLALQLAVARDPLFRKSVPTILALGPGEQIEREVIEALLAEDDPDRFSKASLKSFAQNINGTWTQAGYLKGRTKKFRQEVKPSYVNILFALWLSRLEGRTGQRLFTSEWCKLLDRNVDSLIALTHTASARGLLGFKHVGEVIEVNFSNMFTESEKELLHV